ncbi:CHAT domain-containing protein [Streptomyces globisporus]
MRLSEDVTGWAFLAEVDGARHAGLAVGQAGLGPFTGAGPGGSLFTRAYGRGLAPLASLNELPFAAPVDARWCVHRGEEGVFSVRGPGGLELAYDLDLDLPAGWLETAAGAGALVLVVSHVLPAAGDMVAVLTDEIRQGMVCAGRVRFGPPGHEATGPPTLTYILDPVSVLLELVLHVRDQALSLDVAKRRARELERVRRSLEETEEVHGLSAGTLLELLVADAVRSRGGAADLLYLYWRLVAEVAEECGADAVWREAALRTVESAAPVLAERCERPVFEDADELSGRLIERLEHSPEGSPDGSPDLAAALLAAARLRLAVRGPEDLGGDAYAGEEGTVRAAQHAADLYRSPLYRPWFGGTWPLLFDARLRGEARDLLVRAAETDERAGGPGSALRPPILAALAQVFAEEEGDGGGVDRATARAAFDALFAVRAAAPPDLVLFLLRSMGDAPATYVDTVRENVFGSDVPAFLAAYGGVVAARTVEQGIHLARERADRPLLRAVLDWADRSPLTRSPAQRRQHVEARLHALPDDPTDCAGSGPGSGPHSLGPFPESFPADWTPAQRSAALLHAAAHARDRGQPALGAALLRQAGPGDSAVVRLLTADLYRLAVERGEPVSDRVPFPWGHSTYAALSYASLNQQDLAQACLLPVLQDLPNLSGDALKNTVYAIIVDVPNFDTSGAPALGELLRDLVHAAVWQVTLGIESLPVALMLGLHQAGKGPEAGAWRRIDGPVTRPAPIANYLAKLRSLENPTAAGGATANLLNALDTDPGEESHDDDRFVRNLRRRISSLIDDELRTRSAAFVDDQYLWARTGELLDERSVLLTWFLPTAVNGAAVLLAVTREGSAITVQLGDPDDGGPESAATYADRHPVADLVEAVRTEVERDPLFGEVTPEGRRLLTGHELPLAMGDRWAAWRAQGKDRLLLWPHGALHYLPVALCSVDGRLIADDWTVTTITGLEALVPADLPDDFSADLPVGPRPRRTAVIASATGGVPYGLPAEPALDEHARSVAAAVGADAVTGPAATRAGLLVELATADVIHLAVHGTMDQDAPWLHCLYLTPDEDDDGRVFAHDFLELDLSGVRLVTLAACESALGRFDRADNVRGVPAALITAGVQAVVGCLWAVRPEPAAYFFQSLHQRADLADDPERAFHEAQTATRARYPQYRDWGAFTFLRGRSKGATA